MSDVEILGNESADPITYRTVKLEEIDGMPGWIQGQTGWTTNDATFLKMCHSLDPDGFIAAIHPTAGIVGIVLSVNMNESYSFAGLYLVSKEYRSLGIGKRLWDAMLDHVGTRCLGINSVEYRVKANLKMGMTQPLFKASILNGRMNRDAFYSDANFSDPPLLASDRSIDVHTGHYLTVDDNNNYQIGCENWDPQSPSRRINPKNPTIPGDFDNKEFSSVIEILTKCPNYDVIHSLADLKFCDTDGADSGPGKGKFEDMSFRLVEGNQVRFAELCEYDKSVHGGIPRAQFLKSYLALSKITDCEHIQSAKPNDIGAGQRFVKCLVAIKDEGNGDVQHSYNVNHSSNKKSQVCGYGIIRPRVSHDISSLNTDCDNNGPNLRYRYFIIGPLYADSPYIAKVLFNCLIKSLPAQWPIDLEITVPAKCGNEFGDKCDHGVDVDPVSLKTEFLRKGARDQLGLKCEVDCYRMYQNGSNIPHDTSSHIGLSTNNNNNRNATFIMEGSRKGNNATKYYHDIPDIQLHKVYSMVSSDVFLV